MIKAVLLDLDGTLLDTAPDLAAAGCRVLLVSHGYSEGGDVRSLESDGVVATLREAADLLLR